MSATIQTKRVDTGSAIEYRITGHPLLNGQLHSPEPSKPASEWIDGTLLFYNEGLVHRGDGQPAVIRGNSRLDLGKPPFEYWERGQHLADQHTDGTIEFLDYRYRDKTEASRYSPYEERMLAAGHMYKAEVGKVRASETPKLAGAPRGSQAAGQEILPQPRS